MSTLAINESCHTCEWGKRAHHTFDRVTSRNCILHRHTTLFNVTPHWWWRDQSESYVRHSYFLIRAKELKHCPLQRACLHSALCATWLVHMCDMTPSYVRHDSSRSATWLMGHGWLKWVMCRARQSARRVRPYGFRLLSLVRLFSCAFVCVCVVCVCAVYSLRVGVQVCVCGMSGRDSSTWYVYRRVSMQQHVSVSGCG